MTVFRSTLRLAGLVVALVAGPALAQHAAAAPPPSGTTRMADDASAWISDPHIHAFYDLSVATLGEGTAGVDVAAYEAKAFAIFREFAVSRGVSPEAMQDHLKLIPRQMVQIVRDDPHALDSYKTFTDALFGPD